MKPRAIFIGLGAVACGALTVVLVQIALDQNPQSPMVPIAIGIIAAPGLAYGPWCARRGDAR